ncbi:hypothetical protein ACVIJ6_001482 [Bradyrhizobium sp. USDA 4369]
MVRDGAARLLTMRGELFSFDPKVCWRQNDFLFLTLRSPPEAGVSKGEARVAPTPP